MFKCVGNIDIKVNEDFASAHSDVLRVLKEVILMVFRPAKRNVYGLHQLFILILVYIQPESHLERV